MMESIDPNAWKAADDAEILEELRATGRADCIYGGLISSLRSTDLRGIVTIPSYRKANIWQMVRLEGHAVFIEKMQKANKEFGPLPRIFTQVGWTRRLLDKYPQDSEKYPRDLKQDLFVEGFEQMYSMDINRFWDEQKRLYPDLETQGFAVGPNSPNVHSIYKIDAAGKVEVIEDGYCSDVDSETGDTIDVLNREIKVEDGEQLIVPWATKGNNHTMPVPNESKGNGKKAKKGKKNEREDIEMDERPTPSATPAFTSPFESGGSSFTSAFTPGFTTTSTPSWVPSFGSGESSSTPAFAAAPTSSSATASTPAQPIGSDDFEGLTSNVDDMRIMPPEEDRMDMS